MSIEYRKAYADLDEAIKLGGLTAVKASKNIREIKQGLMSSNAAKIEETIEDDSFDTRYLRKFNDVREAGKRLVERIKAEIEVEDEGNKDEDN